MSNSLTTSNCPTCEANAVVIVQEERTGAKDDHDFAFMDEFSKCLGCGEVFYTRDQSMASSRARATAFARVAASLTPDQIRSTRLNLGMTQAEFEKALGVGRKTVVRWESGSVVPGGAANGLLWHAMHHPNTFLQYARQRGATPIESDDASIVASITPSPDPDQQPPIIVRGDTPGNTHYAARTTTDPVVGNVSERYS